MINNIMTNYIFDCESKRLAPPSIYGKIIIGDGFIRSYDISLSEINLNDLLFQKIAKSTIVGQIDPFIFENLCYLANNIQCTSSVTMRDKIVYHIYRNNKMISRLNTHSHLDYYSNFILQKLSKLLNKKN